MSTLASTSAPRTTVLAHTSASASKSFRPAPTPPTSAPVSPGDELTGPPLSLLYHRPSLPFYREDDDQEIPDGSYLPTPRVSVSEGAQPSSVGLCNGHPTSQKNAGSEYSSS
jgi:hypothetical protein